MSWVTLWKSKVPHNYPPPKKVFTETPFPVSPFIRFTRWALLFSGITYGFYRHRYLKKKEAEYRCNLRKQKIIWDEEQRVKKMIDNRDELKYLAQQTGTPIPTNFDEIYPAPK